MAQDFSAAFALSNTDTAIGLLDAAGVAFGAIQGLNAKLEQLIARQDGELRKLRAELGPLKKARPVQ